MARAAPPLPLLATMRAILCRHSVRFLLFSLWVAALLALFALHFLHLLADFPNHSPWMDYSKYTDEGWYGSAAVRYTLTGRWYLPGDFNPAVALPLWPLLLAGLFHCTGVSLSAARSLILVVFGCNLLLAYAIVRTQAPRWAALLAVTLLLSNPFLYAFSRLAILEPLLTLWILLSWLLALRLPLHQPRLRAALLALIGLLLALAVLTKTTAIFLLPSTLLLIAHACGFRLRPSLRALALTAASALLPWCAWYFLLVRPHYRADYRYFFTANDWPQPATASGWLAASWYALHGTLWISAPLCILALATALLACLPRTGPFRPDPPAFVRNPLLHASLLAIAGTLAFATWHDNPQPRYYEPVVYPLALILVPAASSLLTRTRPLRLAAAAILVLTATLCLSGILRLADYARHPAYTWLHAAQGLTRFIDTHPAPNRLLLSVSGANISLFTQLPSICDEYGAWPLPRRIRTYQPAWFAAWNDLDPGTLAALQAQVSLQRVAAFPALDDPDRNLLVLYRLHRLPPAHQPALPAPR